MILGLMLDLGWRNTLIFLGNREEAHAVALAGALEPIRGTMELPQTCFKHPYVTRGWGRLSSSSI